MVANFQKCRSAISVQRRVPAEIWEIIFRRAFHDHSFIVKHSSFYTPVLVFQTPALVFSQVCARWRAVAIGCSRLWSSIDIHLNAFTPNMTSALQTNLKRSAPQPLSLCIFPGCPPLSANARDAWKLLGPSFSRCETLVWDVYRDDILPEVHGLAFPSLVSFRYTSFPERPKMARAYNWFWRAIRLAPQLTNVVVGDPLPFDFLPYSQLTSLNVQQIRGMDFVEELFRVLPKCSALVSLTLGSPDRSDGHIPLVFQKPIEIPSLRHLAINDELCYLGSDNIILSIMCPNLLLPNLTSFSLHAYSWPSPLSDLLGQKCSDTLERLTVALRTGGFYEENTLHRTIALLEHTPYLTHLELAVLGLDDNCEAETTALLSRLQSLGSDRNPSLPRLQSLHVRFRGLRVTADKVEKVLDLASMRHAAETTCTLTRFRLIGYGPCNLDDNTRERIRQLEEHGIWVGLDIR
ncbi:hypothetical protein PM082_021773 [Marasmius tenuissimus]|nr:hypothetical protein PM082_021773 [Marasmius tenuissimus]